MYGQLRQRGWSRSCRRGPLSPPLSAPKGGHRTVGGVEKCGAEWEKSVRVERRSPEVTRAAAQPPHPRRSESARGLFIHKKKTPRGASESEPKPPTRTLQNSQPRACSETSGNPDQAPGPAVRTAARRSPRRRASR